MAQTIGNKGVNPEDMDVDMDNPTFVPMVKIGKVKQGRDSIQYVELNNIWVYPQPVLLSALLITVWFTISNGCCPSPRSVTVSSLRQASFWRCCRTKRLRTST